VLRHRVNTSPKITFILQFERTRRKIKNQIWRPTMITCSLSLRSKRIAQLATIILATCLSGQVAAAPILFNFSAQLNQVSPALSSQFSTGQIVNGNFRFESTTTDSASAPSTGLYFGAGTSFQLNLGGKTLQATNVDIDITNSPTVDIYRVVGSQMTSITFGVFVADSITLALTDNFSATALTSDALPALPPILGSFNVSNLAVVFRDASNPNNIASLNGTVTSLSAAANQVPLPSSAMLILIGGLALVRIIGHKKSTTRRLMP
jgi:hypothetical protein